MKCDNRFHLHLVYEGHHEEGGNEIAENEGGQEKITGVGHDIAYPDIPKRQPSSSQAEKGDEGKYGYEEQEEIQKDSENGAKKIFHDEVYLRL